MRHHLDCLPLREELDCNVPDGRVAGKTRGESGAFELGGVPSEPMVGVDVAEQLRGGHVERLGFAHGGGFASVAGSFGLKTRRL
jgi:hypothetical protein